MSTPLAIIGAGGHARVVLSIARAAGFSPIGLVESRPSDATPVTLDGVPVLRSFDALPLHTAVALGIGDNAARANLLALIRARHPSHELPTLIHPTAHVEPSASLGVGVVVAARAVVGVGASLSEGVLVNTGAIVDHECSLGPCAHLCPGARLAGRVRVGARAMIGLGAVVIQTRSIGDDAVVGAGAVVVADVPPRATAVGVPAHPRPPV
jgi:sugar O-acyltransferase (sialic acid O-acetyltransferase NeuD family)